MNMRQLLTAACGLALIGAIAIAAEKSEAPKPINKECPISGREVNPDKVIFYAKNVGVCCGNCAKKVEADPVAIALKAKEG